MAKQYTLSDIIKYEDQTRDYCNSEGGFSLLTPELIDLASQEDYFDTDYAEYVIFRRLHQIADYIARESIRKGYLINVTHNQNLKEDLQNNNATKEYYEFCFQHYENHADDDVDTIFSIIDQAIIDKNWNFLYYLYYREDNELTDVLVNHKNNIKDRKFFIIQ